MQCHATQCDRETQNHYATRLDATHFACLFGTTSRRNAIIFNVFYAHCFWYIFGSILVPKTIPKPLQNGAKTNANEGHLYKRDNTRQCKANIDAHEQNNKHAKHYK